jgi:hypothetical protein
MIIAVHMLNYGGEQYYSKWVRNCGKTRMWIRWSNAKHTINLIRKTVIEAGRHTRTFKGFPLRAPH